MKNAEATIKRTSLCLRQRLYIYNTSITLEINMYINVHCQAACAGIIIGAAVISIIHAL